MKDKQGSQKWKDLRIIEDVVVRKQGETILNGVRGRGRLGGKEVIDLEKIFPKFTPVQQLCLEVGNIIDKETHR